MRVTGLLLLAAVFFISCKKQQTKQIKYEEEFVNISIDGSLTQFTSLNDRLVIGNGPIINLSIMPDSIPKFIFSGLSTYNIIYGYNNSDKSLSFHVQHNNIPGIYPLGRVGINFGSTILQRLDTTFRTITITEVGNVNEGYIAGNFSTYCAASLTSTPKFINCNFRIKRK